MSKQSFFWLRRVSWCLSVSFLASAIGYGVVIAWVISNEATYCGNTVTDPLLRLLNVGSPIGFIGAVGFTFFSIRRAGSLPPALICLTVTAIVSAGLVMFGNWFFAVPLDGFSSLSNHVWWMI